MAAVAAAPSASTSSPSARMTSHHNHGSHHDHHDENGSGMQPGAGPSGSSSSLAHSREGPAPSTSDSAAQQHQHQLEASASLEDTLTAQNFADVMCGGCGLTINEDSADAGVVHFATSLWHLECFRCAKCKQKVDHDTNLVRKPKSLKLTHAAVALRRLASVRGLQLQLLGMQAANLE